MSRSVNTLSRTGALAVACLIASLAAPAPARAGERGPVSRWVFSPAHIAGRTVKDLAGKSDAKAQGTFQLADHPDALLLDGASGSLIVAVGGPPASLPGKAISVEAWVACNATPEWAAVIGYLQDNGNFEKGWVLCLRNVRFAFGLATKGADDGNGAMTYLSAKTPIQIGQWYHVVATYDGAVQRIYVDGKPEGETKAQSGGILYPARSWYEIGNYHDDNEQYRLPGLLHEVSVYDRALSAQEVASHYSAKRGAFPQPLEIVEGPVVRPVGRGAVELAWSGTRPGAAIVEFGEGAQRGRRVVSLGNSATHRVVLNGIEPERTYAYRIHWRGPGGSARVSRIYHFDSTFDPTLGPLPARPSPYPEDEAIRSYAAEAVKAALGSDIPRGYAIVIGCEDGRLAYELCRQTQMRIVVVEPDERKVATARKMLDRAGVYGIRVAVHAVSPEKLPFPDGFANLAVVHPQRKAEPAWRAELLRVLHPCRGAAVPGNGQVLRNKPQPGVGEWTHMLADAANTACSGDPYVVGPMRLQWFGRPGPRLMIDRHHRNVPPLFKDGRLFVPADGRVIAVDAYNGTWLWDIAVPNSRRLGVFLDSSNIVVDAQHLYFAHSGQCSSFDAASGELRKTYPLPQLEQGRKLEWSYVARVGGLLFGSARLPGACYTETSHAADAALWQDNMSVVTSRYLFALAPETGRVKWRYQSGVIINPTITIGGGRVYFIETQHPDALANTLGRFPAKTWSDSDHNFLVALDKDTGQVIYRRKADLRTVRHVPYLNYSKEVLLLSGGSYSGKRLWYHCYAMDASTGDPKWDRKHDSEYGANGAHGEQNRHPTIVGDTVYAYPYAYRLATGEPVKDYKFSRSGHGCGGMSASANALFWRGGNPAMRDLRPGGGVSKITHVSRPGCWVNIIPAGGLLLIPEASSGCTCGYPIQTSLAFRPRESAGGK